MNKTNFDLVSRMNEAFGNKRGDPANIDWDRIRSQCKNIPDEVGELFIALGADPFYVGQAVSILKGTLVDPVDRPDLHDVRDALSDVQVFSYGAQHLMGIDGNRDMQSVIAGVMSRFVKDPKDLSETLKKHLAKGVSKVNVEGDYPTVIVRSAEDQPDAPKGKFLKSASYSEPVFYDPVAEQAQIEKVFDNTPKNAHSPICMQVGGGDSDDQCICGGAE